MRKILNSVLFFVLVCEVSKSAPTQMTKSMEYLVKFGYMKESSMTDKNPEMMRNSTKMFQKFFKIPQTGNMDRKTIEMMDHPRCGNPDMNEQLRLKPSPRFKRYSYYCKDGMVHRRNYTKEATFKLKNFPLEVDMDENTARMLIRRAFSYWTRFINVTFKETNENEDVLLSFERRKHSDDEKEISSFDGISGVLAHAFPPTSKNNEIHFDIEENWNVDHDSKYHPNLLQVAVHEIGHHLGLNHSDNANSVMYSLYNYKQNFDLTKDDIKGIQELYLGNLDGDGVEICTENNIRMDRNQIST